MELFAGFMILVWVLALVNFIGSIVAVFSTVLNGKLSLGYKVFWILVVVFVPFGWLFYFGLREKHY